MTAEQEARAQEVVQSSAGDDLKDVASFSSDTSVKSYLEELQPFALANFTKKVSGIIGPLKFGSAKNLDQYALAMMALAQVQQDNNTPASRAVAACFENESLLANAYAEFNREDKGFLDKVFMAPIIAEYEFNCKTAEENLRKIADEHGADLSDYAETEAIKRFLKFVRNL